VSVDDARDGWPRRGGRPGRQSARPAACPPSRRPPRRPASPCGVCWSADSGTPLTARSHW